MKIPIPIKLNLQDSGETPLNVPKIEIKEGRISKCCRAETQLHGKNEVNGVWTAWFIQCKHCGNECDCF